jgi:dihydrolipoamide dehydrogenase
MPAVTHDVVIIGGGPAGYTGAIRAAQLGLNVGVVEQAPQLGGTCLRVGCIPSKALLESSARFAEAQHHLAAHGVVVGDLKLDLSTMMGRKTEVVKALAGGIEGLFKKHKVTRYTGTASLGGRGTDGTHTVRVKGTDGVTTELGARRVLIATGSKEARLKGVELDGDRIGCSTEALSYPSVPGHLVVIGAGAIGLELGSVWRRLGAKVTVLEYLDRILPGMDAELATAAQRILAKQGLEFRLKSKVLAGVRDGDACRVEVEGAEPLRCDRILLAAGRVPNTDGLGVEAVSLSLDNRGRIPVDAHFETAVPGIFAVGDVIAGPMLAHKAEEEVIACVERWVTGFGHVNYDVISYVVYTEPEVASVGKTEEQLKADGVPYRKGSFPFMANGRARALGDPQGFVKMLAHKDTDRILGVHIVGPRASDLITEAGAAMAFGASSEDIARVCHPHPTLSEAIKEAALAVDGRTLNL